MVKSILAWVDTKFEEATDDPNSARGFAKAAGLGAIEGAVDAAAILGVVGLIGGVISCFKK